MPGMSRKEFIRRVGAGSVAFGAPSVLLGCATGEEGVAVEMGQGFSAPNAPELGAIAADMGFRMTPAELEDYALVLSGFFAGAEALDAQATVPAIKYPTRTYTWPELAENELNAWYVKTDIQGSPSGALAGRSLAIKDNVMIADVPMMNGTSVLEGYVPDVDATVVERILDAGGRIVGKSVCEAYCMSGSSHTSDTGPVHNPHRRAYSAGGSSSGSGALVGSGEVDMAIGCDQGGSIRIPASFCGVYGMKPTTGLVPYSGILGFYAPIDHTGPMTQSVYDSALLLEVLAGADGMDPRQAGARLETYRDALGLGVAGLRIGVLKEGFERPDLSEPDVDECVRAAAERFATLGADVREVSIPAHAQPMITNFGRFSGMVNNVFTTDGFGLGSDGLHVPSFVDFHHRWRDRMDDLPATVKVFLLYDHIQRFRHGCRLNAKAANLVRGLRAAYATAFAAVDLLLLPTVPFKPRALPSSDASPAEIIAEAFDPVSNTAPFDETQHPAMSIPCGMRDGLPIGMMLVGRHWEESTIYRAASAFEADVEWRSL